jgi:hypothetical protein
MMGSQSKEMTLNNENNNQSTVNQTLGVRLKNVNLNQQVETSKQIARINKTVNLTRLTVN